MMCPSISEVRFVWKKKTKTTYRGKEELKLDDRTFSAAEGQECLKQT